MEKKLEELKSLMTQINSKINKLKSQTNIIKDLNLKLEALTYVFNFYSKHVDTSQNTIRETKEETIISQKNTKEENKNINVPQEIEKNNTMPNDVSEHKEFFTKNDSINLLKGSTFFDTSFNNSLHIQENNTNIARNQSTIIKSLDTKLQEFYKTKDKKLIANAEKIIAVLKETEASIDVIMKKSGVSKYRCIEIINEIIKFENGIIIKKYENKVFKYYLNK